MSGSIPTIEDSKFFNNAATDGGVGGAVSLDLEGSVRRQRAGRRRCRSSCAGTPSAAPSRATPRDYDGGAVAIDANFRSVTVEDNTFSDNDSDSDRGGGLSIDEAGSVTLDGNTFTGNTAGDDGGGAAIEACQADDHRQRLHLQQARRRGREPRRRRPLPQRQRLLRHARPR